MPHRALPGDAEHPLDDELVGQADTEGEAALREGGDGQRPLSHHHRVARPRGHDRGAGADPPRAGVGGPTRAAAREGGRGGGGAGGRPPAPGGRGGGGGGARQRGPPGRGGWGGRRVEGGEGGRAPAAGGGGGQPPP